MANIKAGDLAVHNKALWEPSSWPRESKGVGFMEAARRAVPLHVVIEDGLIDNYQAWCRAPGTPGPRDANGQPGAYEAALMDRHRLHDPKQPLEIQRTVRSFDPCIACAVRGRSAGRGADDDPREMTIAPGMTCERWSPGRDSNPDLLLRRQLLYPVELRAAGEVLKMVGVR